MRNNPLMIGAACALVLVSIALAGFGGGRALAPKPPAPPAPAYQQVAYSGIGLFATLEANNVPVADLTFESVARHGRGYRVGWIVTSSLNAETHWLVTTNRNGRVLGITMRHTKADAR